MPFLYIYIYVLQYDMIRHNLYENTYSMYNVWLDNSKQIHVTYIMSYYSGVATFVPSTSAAAGVREENTPLDNNNYTLEY